MKDLKKMKKSELQALAQEQGLAYEKNASVEQIIAAIEKNRSNNGKHGADKFKLLKTEYKPREDAKISKEWPTVSGELKILREFHWDDERNTDNESLIIFKVGSHPAELLTFSGVLVAAAEKAEIELISESDDGSLYVNQGFPVAIKPRKLEFVTA